MTQYQNTEWVSEVAQSCPTLCNPMGCSLPGPSICGIFQARVLEWVAISFSRGSPWPRDQTQVSHIAKRHFTVWATREVLMSVPHSYGLPHSSVGKTSTCNAGDPGLIPGLERSAREAIGYPLQYSWAFLVAQLVKESACNVGDLGSIPGLGRSPGEGKGYPLQYSGLENSMGLQRVGKTEWLSFTLYIKILLNIKLKLWGQLKPALWLYCEVENIYINSRWNSSSLHGL